MPLERTTSTRQLATSHLMWTCTVMSIPPGSSPDSDKYVMQDLLNFFGFALIFTLLMFAAYAARAHHFHQSASNIMHTFLDMCCHAAPIGAPAVMIFIGGGCLGRMASQGIELKHSEVTKLAAVCDVVCFDKTGTITGSLVRCLPPCG